MQRAHSYSSWDNPPLFYKFGVVIQSQSVIILQCEILLPCAVKIAICYSDAVSGITQHYQPFMLHPKGRKSTQNEKKRIFYL